METGVEQVDKVQEWRQAQLERAGYDPHDALRLASDNSIDLHYAVQLLLSGCRPKLALEILL